MASGVDVAGVRPRQRRVHTVAARSRRSDGYLARRISDSPWRNRDLIKLVVLYVLGLAGIVICWFGSSGAVDFRDQNLWTAFAALAAAVAVSGGAAWLLAGLAAVARERRLLRDQLAALYSGTALTSAGRDAAADGLVTADGMRRYHRPSCDVMRGKAARPAAGPHADGLSSCGMCQS